MSLFSTNTRPLVIFFSLLSFSALSFADVSNTLPDGSQTGPIRGKTIQISRAEIDLLYDAQPEGSKIDEGSRAVVRAQVRDILMQRALLERGALEASLEDNDVVQRELEAARQLVLANAFSRYLADPAKVTEAEIDTEFKTVLLQLTDTEYEMRRLSFMNESEAQAAIESLSTDQDLLEISEEHSSFTHSINPNDWRWVASKRLPETISDEVTRLMSGSGITPQPVKAGKTWYVVQARAQRPLALPTKSDIIDDMRGKVSQTKVHKWLQNRRIAEGL